jgi:hypothetical protein
MSQQYELLTDKEYEMLSKKYNVMRTDDENIYAKNPKIEKIYDYYTELLKLKDLDEDCKKINKIVTEGIKMEPYNYKDRVVVEDGYRFLYIDKGSVFYKSLTWWYDSIPNTKRTWCAMLDTASMYLKFYYIGMIAYKTLKKTKIFLLDEANLTKLVKDGCPTNISDMIKDMFGSTMTLDERVKYMTNIIKKPILLYKSYECDKNAEKTLFGISNPFTYYGKQHDLYDYIEERFKCDGTIFGPAVTPLKNCQKIEITFSTNLLEIDKDNKYNWMNWNLNNVKEIRHFNLDVFGRKFSNRNNALYYWMKTYKNLDYSYSDILSINVSEFDFIIKMPLEKAAEELISYINKIKPKILALQELPTQFVNKIRTRCNFKQSYMVDNGSYYGRVLAVFTRKFVPAASIKKTYDKKCGSIMLLINNKKLLFVNGPISRGYINYNGNVYRENLYKSFVKNNANQESFLRDDLSQKPDFIIGDFNICHVEPSFDILRKAGFKTDMNDTATNMRGDRTAWAWYKPELSGEFKIYNWHQCIHRPIGYKFDKWNGLSSWDNANTQNGGNWDGNKSATCGNMTTSAPLEKNWKKTIKGGAEPNVFMDIVTVLLILLIIYFFDMINNLSCVLHDLFTSKIPYE